MVSALRNPVRLVGKGLACDIKTAITTRVEQLETFKELTMSITAMAQRLVNMEEMIAPRSLWRSTINPSAARKGGLPLHTRIGWPAHHPVWMLEPSPRGHAMPLHDVGHPAIRKPASFPLN
jgi:hypothetical protein